MQKNILVLIVLVIVAVVLILAFTLGNSGKGSDAEKTGGSGGSSAAVQAEEPVYSNTVETFVEPAEESDAEGDAAEEEPTE